MGSYPKQKIFIGFASDQETTATKVSSWITGKTKYFEQYPWNNSDFSKVGDELFQTLIRVAKKEVIAAVFIIGKDIEHNDKSYPSNNVLLEYGLFIGILGKDRVKICKIGDTEIPSDLGSILHIDLDEEADAKHKLIEWAEYISNNYATQTYAKKETLIIKHLAERKTSHGYVTDSYIKEYCFGKGIGESDVDYLLKIFIRNKIVRKEKIHKEKVFFITKKGIYVAKKKHFAKVKEIKIENTELKLP